MIDYSLPHVFQIKRRPNAKRCVCGSLPQDHIHISSHAEYQLGQADLRAELKKKVEGMKKDEPESQYHTDITIWGAHNQALDAVLTLLQKKGKDED